MEKVRIIWNGQGGELDSKTVRYNEIQNEEGKIANALIEMVRGNIVAAGDSFVIEAVE